MKHDEPQLPHLATFLKVAELASFTRAAEALGVTQAAVSQRIHALEQALDNHLFHRGGAKLRLTVAGRKLTTYAQQIVDLHRQAREEITGQELSAGGELTLAASSIPGERILPSLLAAFLRSHPQLRIRTTVSDSLMVIDQVERGLIDLGLVGCRGGGPGLEFRHLATDTIAVVAAPSHALCRRRRISLQELTRHPFVSREPGSGLRRCFEDALRRAGMSLAAFQVVFELGGNEAVKQAALNGAGWAALSAQAVQEELRSGRLRALPVTGLDQDRELFVVHGKERPLPWPARLFLAFLEAHPLAAAVT